MPILEEVREVAQKRLLFLPHAIRQMSRPQRMITPTEVEVVAVKGELIEDYPQDPRGHSCLLLGFGNGNRAVHVVCSPKDEYLAIITAYLPDPAQWSEDFKGRR
jgi:Domain of unknown function (DUF4258)